MRTFPSDVWRRLGLLPALAAAVLLTIQPFQGEAQVREIISKEISVGRDDAALRLEFADGEALGIRFAEETVSVDGEPLGRFEEDGALESAWRELLGLAVSLDDGPLAEALVDWTPPEELDGEALAVGQELDRRLEGVLTPEPVDEPSGAPRTAASSPEDARQALISLLGRTDRMVELAQAVEGLPMDEIQIRIGEDVLVERDARLEGPLLVVDGDLEVEGEVRGDVVLVGGTLRVPENGRITGDVRLVDARLARREGVIEGTVDEVEASAAATAVVEGDVGDEIRERIRAEIRDELRSEIQSEIRNATRVGADSDDWNLLRPFRHIGRGVAGLFGVLINMVILGVLGGAMVYFGREKLEVVADTARRAPARAGVVGLAGSFLLLPVWVLGTIALAISIIGLPVLLAWIPLFPVAAALAVGMGFFAVASNVGDWLARSRYPYMDWIRSSNPYTLVVGGVVGLLAPFMVANVVEMAGPWLGFLEGVLTALGVVLLVAAGFIGFGAVLLTRAGRRPEYYGPEPDYFADDAGIWTDFRSSRSGSSATTGAEDAFTAADQAMADADAAAEAARTDPLEPEPPREREGSERPPTGGTSGGSGEADQEEDVGGSTSGDHPRDG